jgi:hypothetical protein
VPLYETAIEKRRIDRNLSIGESAVYSDSNTVVTVTMKHWSWSNGQLITARDATLCMNLVRAGGDPPTPSAASNGGVTYSISWRIRA